MEAGERESGEDTDVPKPISTTRNSSPFLSPAWLFQAKSKGETSPPWPQEGGGIHPAGVRRRAEEMKAPPPPPARAWWLPWCWLAPVWALGPSSRCSLERLCP